MNQNKLVKKPLPCSIFDIQGIQSWLDEMALQGLFLEQLSYHSYRAFFQQGEPRPVRYRLDPVGKNWDEAERKENYAQMGWEFVGSATRYFYVFSCGDPEVPELHSDPVSLSYALKHMAKRQTRDNLLILGAGAAATGGILFLNWNQFNLELILREHPLHPFSFLFLTGLLVSLLIYAIFQVLRLNKLCCTLDNGLPLKAGRRHWRPNVPYWTISMSAVIIVQLLNSYALHYSTVQWLDLDLSDLSRPWPSLTQMETAPLPELQPEHYSYMTLNHSSAAPVQEHYTDRGAGFGLPFLKVWHYQTSSPAAARQLYRLARKDLEKDLKHYNSYSDSSESISELTPFIPREHPGVDVLETASFRYSGLAGWAVALRRGNNVLLIRYAGSSSLERGLELFLEALDQSVKGA